MNDQEGEGEAFIYVCYFFSYWNCVPFMCILGLCLPYL